MDVISTFLNPGHNSGPRLIGPSWLFRDQDSGLLFPFSWGTTINSDKPFLSSNGILSRYGYW